MKVSPLDLRQSRFRTAFRGFDRAEVMALLHELNAAGRTIVLITHDTDVAATANRQVHLRDGRVVS